MDLHKLIGETRKINEADLLPQPETVEQNEKPAITPELVAGLQEQVPGLAEVDQEQLLKGMEVEASEHWDSVNGDVAVIAKITKDHLLEFPGKDYYGALQQLESELSETPAEEKIEQETGTEEPAVTTEEPAESTMESKVAEKKSKEIKKDEKDIKKEEKMSKKEAGK